MKNPRMADHRGGWDRMPCAYIPGRSSVGRNAMDYMVAGAWHASS